MESIQHSGHSIKLTPEGHLQNLQDWNEEVARLLAERDGLKLTDQHIAVIRVMRDYYDQYNIAPILKLLKKDIADMLGPELANDAALKELFPRGVMTQGMRVAGLPKSYLDAELDSTEYIQPARKGSGQKMFSAFEFAGKTYDVYPNGNLVHLADWSEALAEHMAGQEGIDLTPAHWEVINFLRQFYFQYGVTPMVRLLMRHMRQQLGKDKSSEEYLYKLFPGGPARQGSRIAGLPAPQGCIDP